jgi:hypothetical protein
MLTEYEVRQRVELIESSELPTMRKVRGLLRLARALKTKARPLIHARALSAQARDCNTASHLDRMVRSLRMLYEEVRLVASRILAGLSPVPQYRLSLA